MIDAQHTKSYFLASIDCSAQQDSCHMCNEQTTALRAQYAKPVLDTDEVSKYLSIHISPALRFCKPKCASFKVIQGSCQMLDTHRHWEGKNLVWTVQLYLSKRLMAELKKCWIGSVQRLTTSIWWTRRCALMQSQVRSPTRIILPAKRQLGKSDQTQYLRLTCYSTGHNYWMKRTLHECATKKGQSKNFWVETVYAS